VHTFIQDFRLGIRMLLKHRGLSVIAVVTITLGIGLTIMIFSFVNGALFKSLPVPDPDQLLIVEQTDPLHNTARRGVPVHDLADWREQQSVFVGLSAIDMRTVNLSSTGDRPERYGGAFVSANLFETVLRVRPVLGRTFRQGEDLPGAEPTILIGHEVWQNRFGGALDVIGRTVTANGKQHTIVGVMPPDFMFPDRQQLWIPLEFDPLASARGEGETYLVVARLNPEVSLDQAKSQMASIAGRIAQQYPESNEGRGVSLRRFPDVIFEQFGPMLLTMLAAVIGVLLIACANVANLLLARAMSRTREVAVRSALGATRRRIVRQLLTEVLVLASVGGVLGMVVGVKGVKLFDVLVSASPPPFWITFGPDHRVVLFGVGMTLFTAIFAGIFPALRASRTGVGEALKDESRGASGFRAGRLTGGLVVAEIAVSCGLLIVAGLMIKSIVRLNTLDLPFATESILTARVTLPVIDYPDSASRIGFYDQLLPRLEAIPSVAAATLSDGLPARGNGSRVFEVEGQTYQTDEDYPTAFEGIVTPGYFSTFEVDVLQGRDLGVADRRGNLPVAMVNESFVRSFLGEGSPIGRRIRMGVRDTSAQWLTVVGVVPDLMMEGVENVNANPSGFYIPLAQSGVGTGVNIALRTLGPPLAIADEARRAVAAIDSDLPIYDVMTMQRAISDETWFYWMFGILFMLLGVVALFLSVVGLYGVMAFAVSRRTREMGIRIALGAQNRKLIGLTMRRGLIQLGIGLVLGIGIAAVVASPLQWILYEVNARDPWVFILVMLTLASVGLLASFIPARRATRVDPMVTLSAE
jgi:putative ABC transport system permease protein